MKNVIVLSAIFIMAGQSYMHSAGAAEERISRQDQCAAIDRESNKLVEKLENQRLQATDKLIKSLESAKTDSQKDNSNYAFTFSVMQLIVKVDDRQQLIQDLCGKEIMSVNKRLADLNKDLNEDLATLASTASNSPRGYVGYKESTNLDIQKLPTGEYLKIMPKQTLVQLLMHAIRNVNKNDVTDADENKSPLDSINPK